MVWFWTNEFIKIPLKFWCCALRSQTTHSIKITIFWFDADHRWLKRVDENILYHDDIFAKRSMPTVCFAHMGNNPWTWDALFIWRILWIVINKVICDVLFDDFESMLLQISICVVHNLCQILALMKFLLRSFLGKIDIFKKILISNKKITSCFGEYVE